MARIAAIVGWLFLLSLAPLHAQVTTLVPKVWNGEALQKDEGLFYLQGSIIDSNAQHKGGSFSFVIFGKNQQKSYSVQFDTIALGQHPDKVWKVKEDEYQISLVQHVDTQGKRWIWKGPYRTPLLVKSRSLSNFGIWYLVQLKQAGQLSILLKASKNIFTANKSQGSIARVIDGMTGRDQATFEQKAAARQGEIRAVFRSTRTIGMYYKLNLFRQNQYAPKVIGVIQSNDPDLRTCFTDFLDRGATGQGTVTYTMLLSNQTQSMKTLKVKQAEIKDERFLECLYYKLMALSFPIKESMIGELSLIFQVAGN
ncbi:MAG TPA: hypothetical protein VE954_26610 [Oligoflexus sp.]|uniref:hypothetical protein n=1 Tax=Oligoflexus sp. TaxID=1971216 RepID=UPI002D23CE20|nr:hypothetical protein [Oligoflexus sp.]HYX36698.1 hypothetical protein [Oligoflexus sp.]